MAAPEPGAKVAKDLGIYLGQIYAYIKKGTVTNHKVGGYPDGKGIEVDPEEVKVAMASSRRRGGKGGGKSKSTSRVHRSSGDSAAAESERAARKERLATGQLISYHKGVTEYGGDKGHAIAVLTGKGGHLTHLSSEDRYHLFTTEGLRNLLAKGIAKLERPEGILGLVMFHWIANDRTDLAIGLETWMESVGLEVSIPDPIVVDEDDTAVIEEPTADDEEEDDDE